MAQREEPAIEIDPGLAAMRVGPGHGAFEGRRGVGIGDYFAPRRIGKGGECLELAAAALAHRIGERIVMVAEEQERRHACALLAHEHERDLRSEHLQRNRSFERAGIAQHGEALAEGAVSDLIVILQKEHEGGRRKIRARRAARLAVTML